MLFYILKDLRKR